MYSAKWSAGLFVAFCTCSFLFLTPVHALQNAPPPQLDTLFLGPKAESGDFLRELLQSIVTEQSAWRKGFHPEDPPVIKPQTLSAPEALVTRSGLKQQLTALSARLQANSNPWFSPAIWGI